MNLLRIDNLNVFQILFPYLGVGTILFKMMLPNGELITVHKIMYPGSARVPTMRNPTLHTGWFVYSTGATSNISLIGICAAGFTDGILGKARNPYGTPEFAFDSIATERVALALRVCPTFPFRGAGERLNLREVVPLLYTAATATANRILTVRAVLNPTIVLGTQALNWTSAGSNTCVEYATTLTATITVNTGDTVLSDAGVSLDINLAELEIRLQQGDVLVFLLASPGGNTTVSHGAQWYDI